MLRLDFAGFGVILVMPRQWRVSAASMRVSRINARQPHQNILTP
jgi:hypothetical protein